MQLVLEGLPRQALVRILANNCLAVSMPADSLGPAGVSSGWLMVLSSTSLSLSRPIGGEEEWPVWSLPTAALLSKPIRTRSAQQLNGSNNRLQNCANL